MGTLRLKKMLLITGLRYLAAYAFYISGAKTVLRKEYKEFIIFKVIQD